MYEISHSLCIQMLELLCVWKLENSSCKKLVDKLFYSINYRLLSIGAYKCGSYARSLLYFEEYIRNYVVKKD